MIRKVLVTVLFVAFLSLNAFAQDARTVIANATRAMGAENVTSLTYSGIAFDVSFLQCGSPQCAGLNLPMRPITNYVRAIDLSAPASRHTGETMNTPGGAQTGPPQPGVFNQGVTAEQAVLTQPWANQLELWITPWGFLKGAAANNATVARRTINGRTFNVLTWSPAVKAASGASHVVNGYVNDQNLVERVDTWLGNNILGDMHIDTTYTDWTNFVGLKVPAKIVQRRGDLPFFQVTVTAASANPPNLAALMAPPAGGGRGGAPGGAPGGAQAGTRGAGGAPPAGGAAAGARGGAPGGAPGGAQAGTRGAGGAPPAGGAAAGARGGAPGGAPAAATSEKIADGVFRITGGYVAMAVEFRDHIMLLEGGDSENRALAIIAEAKRVIPNKPIRYVMNTHPHSDHSGGLATMVSEGATIITHENNREFFDRALNTPRTLLTDNLAQTKKKATVEGVVDKKVYTDGTRTVEMYHIWPIPHTNGMLMAYLPKEKLLFQGDFTLPAAGQQPNDHVKAMVPVLDRLNLDYERMVPVHAPNPDAPWTKADVLRSVGR